MAEEMTFPCHEPRCFSLEEIERLLAFFVQQVSSKIRLTRKPLVGAA